MSLPTLPTLRLELEKDSDQVRGFMFGRGVRDLKREGHHVAINKAELPESMQLKLATLLCCSVDPPTPDIPEVGTRIDETVFWVYLDSAEYGWLGSILDKDEAR